MGLWSKLFGEFVDIIEWTDDSSDTMVYRFERYGNEIKYGAMLTVRESQIAVLINEGRLADVYEPGLYELETNNMPIMTTLENWQSGFNSPFKAEVYFINMRRFTNLKWGTKNPLMLRDKEFDAVRLRAFGTYSIKVKEPVTFLKEIVGTDSHFKTDEITDQLRNLIVSRFATALGESGVPVLDLIANYDDLSEFISHKISPEFMEYGLDLTKLLVENISLPSEVEKALDKRSSMGILGNLRSYSQFQAAEAMEAAANNPSGGAGEGVGLGVGMAMGQAMADSMKAPAPAAPTQSPPALPEVEKQQYFVASEGRQTGPFLLQELMSKIDNGDIKRQDLVWSQQLVEWTAAGQVAELASNFASRPPPLPKTPE